MKEITVESTLLSTGLAMKELTFSLGLEGVCEY